MNNFFRISVWFRKGFSTQHGLFLMVENWKLAVDNSKAFGALLTDLSKAFDCACNDLLIAKLNAYGLSLSALKLVYNYHQKRKQRTDMVLPKVYGKKLYLEFHKNRSWVPFCLTYLSAIYV